ncbi:hypothetical protein L6452_27087 [Arctium lappa]|uniref:Uncharacterized protein n=1 Tax=Arctium lappa TaxID=4217 RepID=A0ACB8ZW96_ARCLA|nr:hypothetical protein L6452_27087 [Arctium lappa]
MLVFRSCLESTSQVPSILRYHRLLRLSYLSHTFVLTDQITIAREHSTMSAGIAITAGLLLMRGLFSCLLLSIDCSSQSIVVCFHVYSSTLCDEERQEQRHPLEESVTNRSYWTRRIHKLCAIDHNVDEAIRLVDNLCIHGYRLDSLNLSSIIHALCDSNRFAEAHRRFLSSLSCSFGTATTIIPDERTCNSLGHCPNVVSYTTLINGYCRLGELSLAHKLLDEMSECGVRPNSLTYSVLIRGILRKKDVELKSSLIEKLWKSMPEEDDGHFVNHAAFLNLIYTLCQEGLFKRVFNVAEMMPQGKSVSDAFAYGQMIDSLCRYGRHHGASRIVYMMMKRGCIPSLVSYNSIVHGLAKNGGYLRAYQLLEQGFEIGYFPSENTYKVLIECLCLEESDLGKAKKLLDIMLNKKGVSKARIYNIYLGALCRMNKDSSTEILNTLVIMLETNCHPDVVTLNTVINGFCKMGKVDEGIKVLDDMVIGKFKFCTPDSVTFTTILSGLLSVGRTREALDVLHKVMPEKGFHPGTVTYNVVLRGLFKLHLANEAMDVFNSMAGGGVVADSTTHAIMIDGLCKCDRIEEAKVFWDDIIWPSGVHDSFVYSAIIKGLCWMRKFDEACDFLYELVDSGVRPNIVNYNILIEGACKLGLKKEAYQIVEK